jgi:hypothetical protein
VWQLDASTSAGVGLTLRLECFPNRKVAWFWTHLVLPERTGPVVVRDHDVPLPRQGLEIRADGLWSELWCETPLEHWTYGLEAFAVALDAPEDALAGEMGERVPIGLDIEWEVDGPLHTRPPDWPRPGYAAPGIVHGDVLLGRERFALDACGTYRRSWGDRIWAAGDWCVSAAGPSFVLFARGDATGAADAMLLPEAGTPIETRDACHEAHAGAARVVLAGEVEVELDVLMAAPVPIDAHTHLDRALCAIRIADATETGWSSVVVTR